MTSVSWNLLDARDFFLWHYKSALVKHLTSKITLNCYFPRIIYTGTEWKKNGVWEWEDDSVRKSAFPLNTTTWVQISCAHIKKKQLSMTVNTCNSRIVREQHTGGPWKLIDKPDYLNWWASSSIRGLVSRQWGAEEYKISNTLLWSLAV